MSAAGPPPASAVAAENVHLARSSAVMAAGTVTSRVLGFARTAVLAAAIGGRTVGDMFTIATTVPNIVYILLAGGVINAVFVPQLVRAMKSSADGGQAYANRLLTLSGLVLAVVTVVVTVAAPLLVRLYGGARLEPDDIALATLLAYWCLPQVFFFGAFALLGQVLNARGSFGPMMWAPAAANVVTIATGLLFIAVGSVDIERSASVSAGEAALLGGGTTLGVLVQTLVLLPVLRRTGFRFRPRLDLRGSGLGKAGALAVWTLLFVLVNQLAYLVVTRVATNAGKLAAESSDTAAGIFVYSSAHLIFILPHSIITVSLVTALLPRMSAAAADGRLDSLADDVATGLRLMATAIVPAAAALVVLAPSATRILFAGAGARDSRTIGLVASAFGLGLLVFSAQYVVLRGFYALEDTRTPFLLQCVIAAANVALVLLSAALLPARWVVVGMAVGYGLAYLLGLALSVAVLRRRTGGLRGRLVASVVGRLLAAGAAAALLSVLVTWPARPLGGGGQTLAQAVVALVVGGLVLLAAYLLLARALRVAEIRQAVATVRGRLGR